MVTNLWGRGTTLFLLSNYNALQIYSLEKDIEVEQNTILEVL